MSVSERTQPTDDVGSSYLATLQSLASNRGELGAAIITLARVAGVDPSPYLGVETGGIEITGEPLKIEFHVPKKDPPPRPQQPAPHETNGAGRAHTVEGELPAQILAVLKKHGEPMQPKDLAKAMRKDWSTVAYHVKKLEKAHQVVLSGTTFDRRVALA